MRPSHLFLLIVLLVLVIDGAIVQHIRAREELYRENGRISNIVTAGLGLTDLCLSTEARYTRHPAVSDPMAPFMDHPGAIEHFPSGSFWAAPEKRL
ncbi:MAG: hypothetical protein ABFQ82_04395 [Thermodesulfobacteriota bacterium]